MATTVFDDLLGAGSGSADDGHRDGWIDGGTEPADPPQVNHQTRRQTRLVGSHFDVTELPKPLVECGCGDCPQIVDPLADAEGAFEDITRRSRWAIEECDHPRPVTVGRAGRIYRAYEGARYERGEPCRTRDVMSKHREWMDAERDLLTEWGDDVTTALLSLRPRPIDPAPIEAPNDAQQAGGGEAGGVHYGVNWENAPPSQEAPDTARYWVPPVITDGRLREGWTPMRDVLKYHLGGFEWRYAWVVGATDSAATPHLHLHLWLRDPDDALTVEHLRPAIESFCRNTPNAYAEDHPVGTDESDAAVVAHDPERYGDVSDDVLLDVFHDRGAFPANTAIFAYCLNQRPEWSIKRICDDASTFEEERTALEGAATAWASTRDWVGGNLARHTI